MEPEVTIIMATYNRENFIVETLESIKKQTFSQFECLIIDDGGDDNTKEVITPILKKDDRFKYLKRPGSYKKGLPGSRNYGLDIAKGNYIIFFDDDDIVHPLNLELCVLELENKEIDFCRYIRKVFVNEFHYNFDLEKDYTSFKVNKKDIYSIIKNELPINSCAVMWKKECFKNNRFTESLMYAEEWELYSRIISKGFNGISINKCLFYGRKHEKSNTGEYYNNNSVRKKSKSDAILLVIKNLKNQKLLSPGILKHFINFSRNFKEYNLFKEIKKIVKLSIGDNLKYNLYYYSHPIRLLIFKVKKKF